MHDAKDARDEVYRTEKQFEEAAKVQGIAEAFYLFADDSAVIKRANDTLVKGREAIRNFYGGPRYKKAQVSWTPDFINVSGDGALAYTYGKYTWRSPDENGIMQESRGVFHTVWKRQADGTWKYVWD